MENPIKMDDLGVHLFSETSIYFLVYFQASQPVTTPPIPNEACQGSRRLPIAPEGGEKDSLARWHFFFWMA